MLPIYICEDNSELREAIKNKIQKQILIEGYDMEIAACSSQPEMILQSISDNAGKGIYFLDVELKGESMDGFTLGREIRMRDANGFLIYVTAFKDLAFQTFRYHLEALDYIVKDNPFEMFDGICKCLNLIQAKLYKEQIHDEDYFSIKTGGLIRHIPKAEIYYLETAGQTHRILLHGMYERVDFIGSLRDIEPQIGVPFLRIHRAYLVNTDLIDSVNLRRNEVQMKNMETCLLSRKFKTRLLEILQK